MTTPPTPEDERLTELLAPLADIRLVPHRERRATAPHRWLRPVLVGVACLTVVVAAGAAIVTSGVVELAAAATSPAPPATVSGPARPCSRGARPRRLLHQGWRARVRGPAGRHRRRRCQAAARGPPRGSPAGTRRTSSRARELESFAVADTIATIKLSGRTPVDLVLGADRSDADGLRGHQLGAIRGRGGSRRRDARLGCPGPRPRPSNSYGRSSRGETIRFAGTADTFEANVQLRVVQAGQGARLDVRDRNLRLGLPRVVRGHDRRPGPRPGRRSHGHGRRHGGGQGDARGVHDLRRGRIRPERRRPRRDAHLPVDDRPGARPPHPPGPGAGEGRDRLTSVRQ